MIAIGTVIEVHSDRRIMVSVDQPDWPPDWDGWMHQRVAIQNAMPHQEAYLVPQDIAAADEPLARLKAAREQVRMALIAASGRPEQVDPGCKVLVELLARVIDTEAYFS